MYYIINDDSTVTLSLTLPTQYEGTLHYGFKVGKIFKSGTVTRNIQVDGKVFDAGSTVIRTDEGLFIDNGELIRVNDNIQTQKYIQFTE